MEGQERYEERGGAREVKGGGRSKGGEKVEVEGRDKGGG